MEEQAIDRVHRLNQTVDVVVYRLTIAGTVEERIFDLQEQKRTLAQAAVEGKAIAKLSMKDILNLFKHDAEQTWKDDKAHENIGARSRVLLEPDAGGSQSEVTRSFSPRASNAAVPRKAGLQDRVGSGNKGSEHAIFGRRW